MPCAVWHSRQRPSHRRSTSNAAGLRWGSCERIMRRLPGLSALKVFEAVGQTRSFSPSAERLNLRAPPPTGVASPRGTGWMRRVLPELDTGQGAGIRRTGSGHRGGPLRQLLDIQVEGHESDRFVIRPGQRPHPMSKRSATGCFGRPALIAAEPVRSFLRGIVYRKISRLRISALRRIGKTATDTARERGRTCRSQGSLLRRPPCGASRLPR